MFTFSNSLLWSNPQPVSSDFFTSYGRSETADNGGVNVCGLKSAGVYTRVQAYLTWIHSIMDQDQESSGEPWWCPAGFHHDPGNVPGRGFKHRDNQQLDQCANFCRKTQNCCSFEYSFERRYVLFLFVLFYLTFYLYFFYLTDIDILF